MSEKVTLEDALKKYPDDQVIHIGSRVSYIFCDTKKEFAADEEIINERMLKNAWKRMKSYHKSISGRVDTLAKERVTAFDRKQKIKRTEKELLYIQKYFDYIENFIPLRKRLVKMEYSRSQRDGLVVIVQGNEVGEFWDLEEYRRKEW